MRPRITAALSAWLVVGAVAAASAVPAHADCTQTDYSSCTCAPTDPAQMTQTDPAVAATNPGPDSRCWAQYSPYPFGFDGNPVDPNGPACQAQMASPGLNDNQGDPIVCYLEVDSMAFRAWNRGIAVVSPPLNAILEGFGFGQPPSTPFGVWLNTGNHWFPDPTFPGQSACPGGTALWAGKLDYWVIGETPDVSYANSQSSPPTYWHPLCRFDGVNLEWEPLQVPKAVITRQPQGEIQTGACFAWDDCWFFGTQGVTLHWDGQSLIDATPDTGTSPWLATGFTAAVAGNEAGDEPFALAVGTAALNVKLGPGGTSGEPDGTGVPSVWRSSGGAFAPLGQTPSGLASAVPVAFASDAQGQAWVAANPSSVQALASSPFGGSPQTAAAPLVPLSPSGTEPSCADTPANGFPADGGNFTYLGTGGYVWSSISVLPNGDALAGGAAKTTGTQAPVLAWVSCDSSQQPTVQLADAPVASVATAVAANADNDAWAATGSAEVGMSSRTPPLLAGVPQLYHLTDTLAPEAPPGDDVESRPIPISSEPSIFVLEPPVVVPAPPPPEPTPKPGKPGVKHVKVKSPIYAVQRPKLVRSTNGAYSLVIKFKVRAKVTVGIEALHKGRVVSSSGLRTFRGKTGELVLKVDVKKWPTALKFIFPKQRGKK